MQNKLKSSQRDKVKRFIACTQTSEAVAIYCLSQNDWKIEAATDDYFQNPARYMSVIKDSKMINANPNIANLSHHSLYNASHSIPHTIAHSSHSMDRRKLDTLFNRYKGALIFLTPTTLQLEFVGIHFPFVSFRLC